MATRIDIELTSTQDDGATFTWRAAGAKQPKGVADASLFPAGSSVGDEFKVEAEMNVDGIEITAVVPAKEKPGKQVQTLELLGSGDDTPLVTQQLAPKGRGDRGDRRDRKGGKGKGAKGGGRRSDKGGPPRTPPKPKLPPKPKPPRLKAGKAHRNALLESLPEEEKIVARQLQNGGLAAVRSGLAKDNEQRAAEGQPPIDDGPLVQLAERLLQRVRAAEWRDRAEAALEQAETVDLRDLRSVVSAADGAAKDDEARALGAQLRQALTDRLEAEHQAWIAEVVEMLDDDRAVRALHLSSRPPKAGAPLPAPVALRLVEAANAAMTADTSTDRWTYILDALAHSPVRRQVVPESLPTKVTPELERAIARHGNRLPEIAEIFGIKPDPKAGRGGRPKRKKKRSGSKDDAKGSAPKDDTPKDDAPKAESSKAESSKAETPKADAPKAESSKAETSKADAPKDEVSTGDAPTDEASTGDAPEPATAPDETPGTTDAAGSDTSTDATQTPPAEGSDDSPSETSDGAAADEVTNQS